MEQRADIVQPYRIFGIRVSHFSIQCILEGFPIRWYRFQSSDPVGHPKYIDTNSKLIRGEGHASHGHIPSIAATDDSNFVRIDIFLLLQPLLPPYTVLQVFITMVLVIHLVKSFAIATATTIVDGEDCVPVINQVLDQREIPHP